MHEPVVVDGLSQSLQFGDFSAVHLYLFVETSENARYKDIISVEKVAVRWYITQAVVARGYIKNGMRNMLDFVCGALVGAALASDGIKVKTVNEYEKAQIDKVLEIANTTNFLGRTLPADANITDSVTQFDQIDGDAIKEPVGKLRYCESVF